jgi:hypothetical protein
MHSGQPECRHHSNWPNHNDNGAIVMATRKLPKFAKRHYEALAQVIQGLALSNNELSNEELEELISVRQGIAGDFANMLGKDNPRFDRERFIRACVPGANVRARKAKTNGQVLPAIEWGTR